MNRAYTKNLDRWGDIIRGGSLENMEQFLGENSNSIGGFLDERSSAGMIGEHGSEKNAESYFVDKNQKYISLLMRGIPKNVANLMIKNEDVLELNVGDMVNSYLYLVNERGLGKTAAATIASSDYFGRGELGSLDVIANHYHLIKSANTVRNPSLIMSMGCKGLAKYPEARIALLAIEDYMDRFDEEVA